MNKKFLIMLLLLILTVSCNESLFEQIAERNITPKISKPTVISLETSLEIKVEWEKDEGADEYILYRNTTSDDENTDEVYEGNNLYYNDTDVNPDTFYYYWLAKRKGEKIFKKSDYVYGVTSTNFKDVFDNNGKNNNTKSKATTYTETLQVNMYYYKDAYGNILEDTDWYIAPLKPGQVLTIRIDYTNNLTENDLYMNIVNGQMNKAITSGDEFIINSTAEGPAYFFISINTAEYLGDPNGIGGWIGSYNIVFDVIQN